MTRRLWGVATAVCWVVAALIAALPAVTDTERCGLPVADALDETNTDLGCVEGARDRVGLLAVWLAVTGGVSTAYIARCAAGDRDG